MLDVNEVSVYYGKIQALDRVSLTVGAGELVTVIGSNGAGKTTLVKAIMGLLPIRGGTMRLGDVDLTRTPAWDRVRHGIAYVPEGARIFRDLTVEENIRMGAFARRDVRIGSDMERVYTLFPRLQSRARQLAGTLSGGEQQMLAISRCLMAAPRLLLIDEMSLGLMPVLVSRLFSMVRDLVAENIAILLIEQNAKKALEVAHRGYLLENGRVVEAGDSAALMNNNQVRQAYLGG